MTHRREHLEFGRSHRELNQGSPAFWPTPPVNLNLRMNLHNSLNLLIFFLCETCRFLAGRHQQPLFPFWRHPTSAFFGQGVSSISISSIFSNLRTNLIRFGPELAPPQGFAWLWHGLDLFRPELALSQGWIGLAHGLSWLATGLDESRFAVLGGRNKKPLAEKTARGGCRSRPSDGELTAEAEAPLGGGLSFKFAKPLKGLAPVALSHAP